MSTCLGFVVSGTGLIIPVAFGALLVAFVTMLIRSMRLTRELESSRQVADEDRRSGQALAQELKESIRSLQRESRELSELNFKLPSLMKQLTVDLERRSLGPLILKVLDQIFTPSQAIVFFSDEREERLTLVAAKGLDEGPLHPGAHIQVGDGRIGFAARKQVCMGPRDFRLESNLNREQIQKTEPVGVRSDLCAPLVSNSRLLGAISMGLPRGWASIEVKRLFGMVADVGALALASNLQYRKIQQLANSDPLTGIHNKGYYMKKAARILRDAERFNRKAAVVILDVDHFKNFNDTQGHLAGDRVLRGIGDILKQHVREGDIAARFGGEEFVVLITEADEASALQVAERIRIAVGESTFNGLVKDPERNVTVSGGVAVFPEDGVHLDDLIGRADVALYRAKESGRNAVLTFADVVGRPVVAESEMEEGEEEPEANAADAPETATAAEEDPARAEVEEASEPEPEQEAEAPTRAEETAEEPEAPESSEVEAPVETEVAAAEVEEPEASGRRSIVDASAALPWLEFEEEEESEDDVDEPPPLPPLLGPSGLLALTDEAPRPRRRRLVDEDRDEAPSEEEDARDDEPELTAWAQEDVF